MRDFQCLLNNRTWRGLRAIAKAHRLPFHTHLTRSGAIQYLRRAFCQPKCFQKTIQSLPQEAKQALFALKAWNGEMPLRQFCAHFGDIRPYRPWRKDAPPHPWRNPISPAEQLWYLGLVEIIPAQNGVPARLYTPQEVLDNLPPLPQSDYQMRFSPPKGANRQVVLVDMAIFLGLLVREKAAPIRGQWLPIEFLRLWNGHCTVADQIAGIRQERGSGRLKFLHYLAEIAGLVTVQNGYLLPTVAAWQWLDDPPAQRWEILWRAIGADLRSRQPKWNLYQLPPITADLWDLVIDQLETLPIGAKVKRASFIMYLQHYLPPLEYAPLTELLLDTVLTWAGIVCTDEKSFDILPREFLPEAPAQIQSAHDALWLTLPALPLARPLAELVAIATWDQMGLRIDTATVRRAIENGGDAMSLLWLLSTCCDQPLPLSLLDQLRTWEQAARQLSLRHSIILSSPDAYLLASLRQNRHLRGYFVGALSAHHVEVKPEALPVLRRKLARRGYPILGESPKKQPALPYIWVAGRVLQELSRFARLPLYFPSASLPPLPDEQRDGLNHVVAEIVEAIRLASRERLYAPVQHKPSDEIRTAIETAYIEESSLTIDYFSLLEGQLRRRTITPLTPISQQDGAEYVEAWCERASASRTFRLDRIMGIVETIP